MEPLLVDVSHSCQGTLGAAKFTLGLPLVVEDGTQPIGDRRYDAGGAAQIGAQLVP